jgi:hypothetical protein
MIAVTFPGFLSFCVKIYRKILQQQGMRGEQNPSFHDAIVQRTGGPTVKRRGFRPTFAAHLQAFGC